MRINHLRIFGTECFVHIPKDKRRKLDKKVLKGHMVGYADGMPGYRIWIPKLQNLVISRVIFKEEIEFKRATENEAVASMTNECETVCEQVDSPEKIVNVRELRDRDSLKKLKFFGNPIGILAEYVPNSFEEAMKSGNVEKWKNAMKDEMQSVLENKTWLLVEKPKDKRIIENRWVFRQRPDSKNLENRYKARLVINCCSQKEGVDFFQMFSSVIRFDTVRVVLSIMSRENLNLRQFDVKTAFLYGRLDEDIYMKQPESFKDGTSRVCKLLRSLYGLK